MARTVILGAGIAGHTAALHLRRLLGKEHEVVMLHRALLGDVRTDVNSLNRQIRAATAEQERLDAISRLTK